MSVVVRFVWLVLVWLVLWSDLSIANVASGCVVAGAIVLTVDGWWPGRAVIRPLRAMRYVAFVAAKLVESTGAVALAVLSPRTRVCTGIVAVELEPASDAIVTLVANSVNLTPGTVIVDIDRDSLTCFIHALDVRDADRLVSTVRRLEELALAAFGPAGPAPETAR